MTATTLSAQSYPCRIQNIYRFIHIISYNILTATHLSFFHGDQRTSMLHSLPSQSNLLPHLAPRTRRLNSMQRLRLLLPRIKHRMFAHRLRNIDFLPLCQNAHRPQLILLLTKPPTIPIPHNIALELHQLLRLQRSRSMKRTHRRRHIMLRSTMSILLRQHGKVACFCIDWAFWHGREGARVPVCGARHAGEEGLFRARPGAVFAGGAEEEAAFGVGGGGVVEGCIWVGS